MSNYTFLIKWIDADEKSHTVGVLSKENEVYYFKYNSNDVSMREAKSKGFLWIPTFFDEKRVYSSKKLFDFFESRLPKDRDGKDEADLFELDYGKVFTDRYYLERVKNF